jgi:hypothetical protein
MAKGIPHQLMRARCRFCGRGLRYANLPNRGPVMVHGKGESAFCQRLIATGNDIPTREAKRIADEADRARRLAELKERAREAREAKGVE